MERLTAEFPLAHSHHSLKYFRALRDHTWWTHPSRTCSSAADCSILTFNPQPPGKQAAEPENKTRRIRGHWPQCQWRRRPISTCSIFPRFSWLFFWNIFPRRLTAACISIFWYSVMHSTFLMTDDLAYLLESPTQMPMNQRVHLVKRTISTNLLIPLISGD